MHIYVYIPTVHYDIDINDNDLVSHVLDEWKGSLEIKVNETEQCCNSPLIFSCPIFGPNA
jgi:hypothetical protein